MYGDYFVRGIRKKLDGRGGRKCGEKKKEVGYKD